MLSVGASMAKVLNGISVYYRQHFTDTSWPFDPSEDVVVVVRHLSPINRGKPLSTERERARRRRQMGR